MTWQYIKRLEEGNYRKPILVITSGHMDPYHVGHCRLLKACADLGDDLLVIVNTDEQIFVKRGKPPFQSEQNRLEIIDSICYVDIVELAIDKDSTVTKTLESIFKAYHDYDFIFAKGGDRTENNMPQSELDVCKKYGCTIVYGVGGDKIASSSDYKE